jgi:hypothetical protein
MSSGNQPVAHSTQPATHGVEPSPATLPTYANEKGSSAYAVDVKDNSSSDRDEEKVMGTTSSMSADGQEEVKKTSRIGGLYRKHKIFAHLAIWLVVTGYVFLKESCARDGHEAAARN